MREFTCGRCGVHVIIYVGHRHPELTHCLECWFVMGIRDPEMQAAFEKFRQRRKDNPAGTLACQEGAGDAP